ncbi:hydrolase or acyltransferase (alpha beta hydrolase superfamily) [Colletotrichum tofieldiae]|uniref:Hydrolase or acyltransferase (Alpha beta hydrolase superfamily) n=1 Tax=Colletotrichum tofieldiae TaxID=708197 RepID=A0A166LRB0_9PEZI|nr:hydrolase or acyltransferase (alpha beta hydrolase superfamily) [Colletotrichum tofieldiae]
MTTSSYFTAPSGNKIHFLQSGSHSGPLLVCFHGLGGSNETFLPLLPSLPQSFNIILVDFPGFGKSFLNKAAKPITVTGTVSDIHCLISFVQESAGTSKPEKIICIGHSFGAIVALHYAAKYPEAVAGLALLGPGRAAGHIPAVRQRMLELASNVRSAGIGFAADAAAQSNFYGDTPERSASQSTRGSVRKAVAGSDPEGYAQTCEALVDLDHTDPDYKNIKCSTVFVAGDKDVISPVDRSMELSKLIGGESWLVTVRSGHQQVLEDTEGVGKALEELFARLEKSP